MRARVGLIAAVLAMVSSGVVVAPAGAEEAPEVRAIVVLEPGVDVAATAQALISDHGGRSTQRFENVLGGFEFVGAPQAVAALSRAPGVRAVVPDETFALVDVAGMGFFRIAADQAVTDPQGPYRGAGTRVAVIDSGIDISHPDLAPNLDVQNSYNCVDPGSSPQDDNGHGTHVAGIAAAAFNPDGSGLVGVAPAARIVALKAFDASGNGTTAQIVCALDHLAAVIAAAPMPTAVNMSFADLGGDSACDDGITTDVLHEALCDVVATGVAHGVPVVPVAAAGNESMDAATTIPAAFHDVIAVSAYADLDGAAGGLAGCPFLVSEFNSECDDTLAAFSNWGPAVDLAAPGVDIYSDLPGGFGSMSGTSMAAPHVTGVVALVLGANASLDGAGVRSLLLQTGECPDGTEAGSDATCAGQGQWQQTANQSIFDPVGTKADPDGIAEPLVNAHRAARAADAGGDPPTQTVPVMFVSELTASSSGTKRWTATATVTVHDDRGNVVAGATVTFAVASSTTTLAARGGGPNGATTPTCVTGVDGRCAVSVKTTSPSVRFAVASVTKAGYIYDPSANTANEVIATKP